jgi:hypothetical protein
MPWDALPERLRTPEAWKNTDWDRNFLQRWLLRYKGLFAFGPRATEWWARWREWPITLFAIRGKGKWRLEDDVTDYRFKMRSRLWWEHTEGLYLSRCQKYSRWSFQLQWPLFIAIHWYPDAEMKTNPWVIFLGSHRDADKVYWISPFIIDFIGRTWK